MGNRLSRAEKRSAKEARWNDPLGIDKMSDEEFLAELPRLERRAGGRGVGGVALFLIAVILLALLWNTIFGR